MWPIARLPGSRSITARRVKLSPTSPKWRSAWNTPAVEGDDAGALLAAMLKGMQAEGRELGRVLVAEDAEDAAFLVELVVTAAGQTPGLDRPIRRSIRSSPTYWAWAPSCSR